MWVSAVLAMSYQITYQSEISHVMLFDTVAQEAAVIIMKDHMTFDM